MDIRDDAWKQVWGDANPCKYGGVFARMDGEAVRLFSLEPVRDLVGDNEAAEVGFTYWRSEGYYDLSDLKYNDTAESVLKSVGAEETDDEAWYAMPAIERAVLLFEQGYGKEPALERAGGFTEDVLGDEIVLDQSGEDIHLGCLEEDDEFRQEILGEFEVFVCLHCAAGCLPDNEPFLVLGRHGAAEWVRDQVVEMVEGFAEGDEEIDEEKVLAEWRGSPLSAETRGIYRATAEIYHVFKPEGHGPMTYSIGHEAADALIEAYNEGEELERYVESQGGDDYYSDEALELLEGAPR
jgi:hypothetical protein